MTIFFSNEAEYEAALARVEFFFDMPEEPDPESEEGKEFTSLIEAIVAYETIHYPIESPPPSTSLDREIPTEIQLSLEGQRRFAVLMAQAPKPTKAMKALGELPDFDVNDGNV